MEFKVTFTPKFDSKIIYYESIVKPSAWLSSLFYELGDTIFAYMQEYISSRIRREGKTGNLANSIKLYHFPSKELGVTEWGIGFIPEMSAQAPYWALINFGGLTPIAREGRGVSGYFGLGDAPDPTKRGTGVGTQRFTQARNKFFMRPTSPIKPMNYIESSRFRTELEINRIISVYLYK